MSAIVIALPGVQLPVTASRRTRASKKDPVFAAIERHRNALWARWTAQGIYANAESGRREYEELKARSEAAWDREATELDALLECSPTTADGMLALLIHLAEPEDGPEYQEDETIISGATDFHRAGDVTHREWSIRLGEYAKRISCSAGRQAARRRRR
jgi:hypothetical protein